MKTDVAIERRAVRAVDTREPSLSNRLGPAAVTMIDRVRVEAKHFFETARGSHDWDHTVRVCRLCRRIGRAEKADMLVVMIAAYLHDIGRCRQDRLNGAVCHAEEGARMAEPIISKLALTDAQRKNADHCIRTHRFRGGCAPQTIEARVLFDADKLDAIGAVGVARAFLFAGEVGARLHSPDADIEQTRSYSKDDTGFREYTVKLRHIKDRILTDEGQRLAETRHAFMARFFERFLLEYEGKE